jgi:hypothetical protein
MLNLSLMIFVLHINKINIAKYIKLLMIGILLSFSISILTYEIYYEVLSPLCSVLSLGFEQSASNTTVLVLVSLFLSLTISYLTYLICLKYCDPSKMLV